MGGRATKAMAKVASDWRCCRWIALREEDMRKHNNGRSGVNCVEELNGRANERGDKDFLRELIGVFLLVVECCRCCIIFSYFFG